MLEQLLDYFKTGPITLRLRKYQEFFATLPPQNKYLLVICLLEELENRVDHRCAKLLHGLIIENEVSFELGLGRRELAIPGKYGAAKCKAFFHEDLGLVKIWEKHQNASSFRCVELLAEADDLWNSISAWKIISIGEKLNLPAPPQERVHKITIPINMILDKMNRVLRKEYSMKQFESTEIPPKPKPGEYLNLTRIRHFDEDMVKQAIASGDIRSFSNQFPSTLSEVSCLASRGRLLKSGFFEILRQKIHNFVYYSNEVFQVELPRLYSFLIYIGALEEVKEINGFCSEQLNIPRVFVQAMEMNDYRVDGKIFHEKFPLFSAAVFGKIEMIEYILDGEGKSDKQALEFVKNILTALKRITGRADYYHPEAYDFTKETFVTVCTTFQKYFPELEEFKQNMMKMMIYKNEKSAVDSWDEFCHSETVILESLETLLLKPY